MVLLYHRCSQDLVLMYIDNVCVCAYLFTHVIVGVCMLWYACRGQITTSSVDFTVLEIEFFHCFSLPAYLALEVPGILLFPSPIFWKNPRIADTLFCLTIYTWILVGQTQFLIHVCQALNPGTIPSVPSFLLYVKIYKHIHLKSMQLLQSLRNDKTICILTN